jgi:hypothetical protein
VQTIKTIGLDIAKSVFQQPKVLIVPAEAKVARRTSRLTTCAGMFLMAPSG